METVRTVADLRKRVQNWCRQGLRTAVVPTMGGLHEGHLSLVQVALQHADRAIATLFVNPTQFSPLEDLDAYPRDEARDAAMLEAGGCHLLFAPDVTEMYPQGFSTRVIVDGLTDCLCGAARKGHFDGVAQVVTKLLNQAQADIAIFGEKDWQQKAVVMRLAQDLDIPTRIVGAPTIREHDGLAMSSRNRYLTDAERRIAARLPALMTEAAARIGAGEKIKPILSNVIRRLETAGFRSVDYVEARTAEKLEPITTFDPDVPARLFAAAHLGKARLIDNIAIQT